MNNIHIHIEKNKAEIINRFKNETCIESLTFIGRYYNSTYTDVTYVNDLDIHIIVKDLSSSIIYKLKNEICDILLANKNESILEFSDIYNGPFKPNKIKNKIIFFYHLILDDLYSLYHRKKVAYPTLVAWSKYTPAIGSNKIKNLLDRDINVNDVINSRFGIENCIKYITNGSVYMDSYKNGIFKQTKIILKDYYGFYFLYYSIMQSVRNTLRLKKFYIEFMNSQSVRKLFFDNYNYVYMNDIECFFSDFYHLKTNINTKMKYNLYKYSKITLHFLKFIKGICYE